MNNFSTGRNLTYQIKNCPTKAVHKNCLSWRCHRTTGPICKVWHCFHSSSYPFKKLGIVHYCLFFKCSYSLLSKTKEKRSFAHNLRISGIIFILKFDSIHSDKINFKSLNIINVFLKFVFHGLWSNINYFYYFPGVSSHRIYSLRNIRQEPRWWLKRRTYVFRIKHHTTSEDESDAQRVQKVYRNSDEWQKCGIWKWSYGCFGTSRMEARNGDRPHKKNHIFGSSDTCLRDYAKH